MAFDHWIQYGGTALILAAVNGQTQTVKTLIEQNANLEAKDKVSCLITSEYEVLCRRSNIVLFIGWQYCARLGNKIIVLFQQNHSLCRQQQNHSSE